MCFSVGCGRLPKCGLGLLLLFLMVGFAPIAWSADALKGVALVIGNGDYAVLGKLSNPVPDARAVDDRLAALGIDTRLVTDRDAEYLKFEIERFATDAEGADVALVYYAGHGVEAGGDNWLIPVDADFAALDQAEKRLISLSSIVRRLKQKVPVVIVLFDACSGSPFPAGATLKPAPGDSPVPVTPSGLGALGKIPPLGTIVGFAAAPGEVALDGMPGANGPYAAALLKHLDAMADTEFGDVMRMVAEEAYLKTGGLQRPWVNDNLRRLIYFGKSPAPPSGEEGDLLRERRELLLAIDALPDVQRRQVEAAAAAAGVPMDALFGMLKLHGVSEDAAEMEDLLHAQAERLREIIAARTPSASRDPELHMLAMLADQAISEGALKTAITLDERAKTRLEELEKGQNETQADRKARDIEAAQVYAHSADAHALAAEHLKAALDYAKAFERVEHRDDRLAWHYRNSQAGAALALAHSLSDSLLGGMFADPADILRDAVRISENAVALADRLHDPDSQAMSRNNMADALLGLAEPTGDQELLERAVATYQEAFATLDREKYPLAWAATQYNLGTALQALPDRKGDIPRLEQAYAVYRGALNEYTRDVAPLRWAATLNKLGMILHQMGEHGRDADLLEQAAAAYQAALEERTRERVPREWAETQYNLGVTLRSLYEVSSGTERLEEAVAAFRSALLEWSRVSAPVQWADAENNLGLALLTLAEGKDDVTLLEESVVALRTSLLEVTREREPLQWAMTQDRLGYALRILGTRKHDASLLHEAVAAHRAALENYTYERFPSEWASTQIHLGDALYGLGHIEKDPTQWEAAAAAYRQSLKVWTREKAPSDWATAQLKLGDALLIAGAKGDMVQVKEALEAYRSAIEERPRARVPLDWAEGQYKLGQALLLLSTYEDGARHSREAISAFRAALEEYRRDRSPDNWATLQLWIGEALRNLAEHESGTAMLEEAAAAYRASLQEFSQETTPFDWARAELGLAETLASLGEHGSGTARFDESIVVYRRALALYDKASHATDWARTMNSLSHTTILRGKRSGGGRDFEEILPDLREAIQIMVTTGDSQYLPYAMGTLCDGLIELGRHKRDVAMAREAVQSCEQALQGMNAAKLENAIPITEGNLKRARQLLAELQPAHNLSAPSSALSTNSPPAAALRPHHR